MKIATWNVNSLNVRLPHVLEWLASAEPDVLVLQEIKQVTEAFPEEAFKEAGLFDKETAQRFREHILSKGGTRPGMELYREFRGRDPVIDPLMERRGLTGT